MVARADGPAPMHRSQLIEASRRERSRLPATPMGRSMKSSASLPSLAIQQSTLHRQSPPKRIARWDPAHGIRDAAASPLPHGALERPDVEIDLPPRKGLRQSSSAGILMSRHGARVYAMYHDPIASAMRSSSGAGLRRFEPSSPSSQRPSSIDDCDRSSRTSSCSALPALVPLLHTAPGVGGGLGKTLGSDPAVVDDRTSECGAESKLGQEHQVMISSCEVSLLA